MMRRNSTMPPWFELVLFISIALLIVPSNQLDTQQQQSQHGQEPSAKNKHDPRDTGNNRNASSSRYGGGNTMTVPYFRTSIPMRIYECLRDFSTLRCTKLFVLQKMEERKSWINTGNITKDFLNQFFDDSDRMGSLISERFRKMPENELNKKLVLNFQRFFKNRDIKMRFLPGLTVKVVPNKDNKLKFSLKKKTKYYHEGRAQDPSGLLGILKDNGLVDGSLEAHENVSLDEDDVDGKSKRKGSKKKPKRDKTSYKTTILQMAVPVMVNASRNLNKRTTSDNKIMPAILMGTFLPFILPVLKMATLTTMIMNNTAFMAALIYAARQHVNAQDEQHINYSYGGHPGGFN